MKTSFRKLLIAALLTITFTFSLFTLTGCKKSQTIYIKSDSEISIEKDFTELHLYGNANSDEILEKVCITIQSRQKDLTIYLYDCKFQAKTGRAAINCKNNSFNLKIVNSGSSYIVGGRGAYGEDGIYAYSLDSSERNGSNGADGLPAINCGNIIFDGVDNESELTLISGNGGNGGDGATAKIEFNPIYVFFPICKIIQLVVPDGGNGGNSPPALCCNKYTRNTNLVLQVGQGGKKGKAGYRGDYFTPMYGKDGLAGESSSKTVGDYIKL